MAIMRLAYPGSLVGFDSTRSKIWDSHVDSGRYTDLALSLFAAAGGGGGDGGGGSSGSATTTTAPSAGKINNSTLEISDRGVRIYGVGEDGGVVVTWRIDAPGGAPEEEDESAAAPTAGTTTTSPTTAVSFLRDG